jgi:hypothetical protein
MVSYPASPASALPPIYEARNDKMSLAPGNLVKVVNGRIGSRGQSQSCSILLGDALGSGPETRKRRWWRWRRAADNAAFQSGFGHYRL